MRESTLSWIGNFEEKIDLSHIYLAVIESKWCKKWLGSIKPGSFKSTAVSMLQSGERQKQQKEWNGEQKCYILTWHFQGK